MAFAHIHRWMAAPLPNWTDSAKRFWANAEGIPHLPTGLSVTCIDDGRTLQLGESGDTEIHGTAAALEEAMFGRDLLVQMVIKGKLRYRGSFAHLASLSQAGQQMLLGEWHGHG